MARGVSTVLDVSLCLLLVGAAVATLALAVPNGQEPTSPDADETAGTLATATASVPAGGDSRTAHDTLVGHLGRAPVANATIEGNPLVESDYPAAVSNETRRAMPPHTAVTARWEPYYDGPLGGTVRSGPTPPPDASVAVTTMTVDTGIEPPSPNIDSLETLARELAESYVAWLFPPERTRARLLDSRTAPSTAERYRTAAESLDADVSEPVASADTRSANDALASALATELEADLRDRYDTPKQARADVRIDAVEVVVRRWKP